MAKTQHPPDVAGFRHPAGIFALIPANLTGAEKLDLTVLHLHPFMSLARFPLWSFLGANMRNKLLLAMLPLGLTGCATSSAGLYRTSVETTVSSSKTSQQFATCVAETLQGNNPLRNEGDHYWVLRMNGYGVPIIRWDFLPKPDGGSVAELRTTLNFLSAGTTKVQACAGN